MANKTIHQLSAMNEFDSGDEFAVYDTSANTTGKMTIANVLGTSITGLGTTATTIPGAISELNTGLGTVNTLLGSGDISSIGDGSVTGAISSLNNDLVNLHTITNAGITVTRTSGAPLESYSSFKYGKIICLRIMLNVDTTYAPGANLFVGSIDTHLPVIPAISPGYQSSSQYQGYLNTNGELTCRVVGSGNIAAGKMGIYLIYLTNS